jgi:hypothetical protein
MDPVLPGRTQRGGCVVHRLLDWPVERHQAVERVLPASGERRFLKIADFRVALHVPVVISVVIVDYVVK